MILRRLDDLPQLSDAFSELERMKSEMDSLFGRISGSLPSAFGTGVFPSMNITEDPNTVYVRAELPGVKADEMEISAAGNSLVIAGERKIPAEGNETNYHRRERETGSFRRTITLPPGIDSDKVEARFKDGVLTVTLPKAEASKPKQITVQTT